MTVDRGLVRRLRGEQAAMLEAVESLVNVESPSSDRDATAACARAVSALGERLLGVAASPVDVDGCPHLRWDFGSHTQVLLLGHHDTVWPLGTLARWPFRVDDGRATGPGVFDMKAGIVQGLFALTTLDDLDGVSILLTGDEELGSPTSRQLVEDAARGADAVLVLEPSAGGALKTVRKGVSLYRVAVTGRAAHAGLDPEKGVNALVELSRQVLAVADLADAGRATTVTPSVAAAGTASNVVPSTAWVDVDVRAATPSEQQRVDDAMRGLAPTLGDASISVTGGINRPPLDAESSVQLLARARELADELGISPLEAVAVGGASDGNFTAGIGVPTLDGLGAVGDGAHADGEHILVDAMAERAALVGALVRDLLSR